jgi:hypothetical protein
MDIGISDRSSFDIKNFSKYWAGAITAPGYVSDLEAYKIGQ